MEVADAARAGRVERRGDLAGQRVRLLRRERRAVEEMGKRRSQGNFGGDVAGRCILPDGQDADDVGVVDERAAAGGVEGFGGVRRAGVEYDEPEGRAEKGVDRTPHGYPAVRKLFGEKTGEPIAFR